MMMPSIFAPLLFVLLCHCMQARPCNFNETDPNRDARCGKWAGLEPIAVTLAIALSLPKDLKFLTTRIASH